MRWITLVALAGFAAAPTQAADPTSPRPVSLPAPSALAPTAIAAELRQGGLVLYMRHPETERAQTDGEQIDFNDCSTQRNLSGAGRQSAMRIGDALREVGATIDRAVTSEYCRARETAHLMRLPGAEVNGMLNDGGRMAAAGPASLPAEALRSMLRAEPTPGRSVVIIAHRPNLGDAVGPAFADLAEGEVAIFRASPSEPGFAALGRVRPQDWADLLRSARH
jgi:phosphohistidine phosphatase SixA